MADDTDAAAPPAAPAAADPSPPPEEEEEEEVKNDSEGATATPSAGGADEDAPAAAVAAGTTAEDAGAGADAAGAADAAAVTSAALTASLSSLAVAATVSSSAPPVEVEDADGDEDGGDDGGDDDDDEDDDEDYDPDGDDDAEAYANEFLSLLPPCVLPRVERLKSLNAKRDLIMEEYRLERAALEIKYSERMAPLYVERRDVVNGEYDMAIQEEKWSEDKKNVPPPAPVVEEGGGETVKGIPQFWACAMGHVDVIAELITEADVDCLEHLTDITCTDFPDGLGFELNFHFSPNDFFHNAVLTKRYEVPNLLTEDEPILKNVTGTDIKWKRDRSLTFREVTKKQRKKGKGAGAGQVRSITKKERTESFFHFFTPMKMPALMDVVDEDEADAVEEAFDHDYDVAQAFRNHVIKKAVLWYTGEAMLEDDYDEEGMMGGEDEDEDEGGDGDGGGGDDPFPRPAAGDGENPECKQN